MNIESIEILLVVLIAALQIISFIRTFVQIRKFREVVPGVVDLTLTRLTVPVALLQNLAADEILDSSDQFRSDGAKAVSRESGSSVETRETIIVECDNPPSGIFSLILHSLNSYLIRNAGAVADFNLIKDITERNIDAVDDDVNLTVSLPLYLGLMGTMLGIVIGLFSMSSLAAGQSGNADGLGAGINVLLGGVKIAMIASFAGLFLTTVNTTLFYKGAKRELEARKNLFYSFLQAELLPSVNQSFGTTLHFFQQNLFKFNEEFTGNLDRLSGVFNKNYDALVTQDAILTKLQELDISAFAKYNVTVLKELRGSMGELEKFRAHAANISASLDNSTSLLGRMGEVLARTDEVHAIAANLEGTLSASRQLMQFLTTHFEDLEKHREQTKVSITEVGFSISQVFKDLEEQIGNSTRLVKEFTVEESELLKKALSESRTNLSNLDYLKDLKGDVSTFKVDSSHSSSEIKKLLAELNANAISSLAVLELIENAASQRRAPGIKSYFNGWFNSDEDTK